MDGVVYLVDANGTKKQATIESNGEYSLSSEGLKAPFLLYAKGQANGKPVTLLYLTRQAGEVNLTPATHMMLAMALGKDPAGMLLAGEPHANFFPSEEKLSAAQKNLETLFSGVLLDLNLSGFNMVSSHFEATGEGFDQIFDVVEMKVDAQGVVSVVDCSTRETLFSDDPTKDDDGKVDAEEQTKIRTAVNGNRKNLDAFKAIFKSMETLYASEKPTLQQLTDGLKPSMATHFLEKGLRATEMLEAWADTQVDLGPTVGFKLKSIAILRPMKDSLPLGDLTVSELKTGETEGFWCVLGLKDGSLGEYRIQAFVKESGEWRWAGDRSPVTGTERIQAEVCQIQDEGGTTHSFSGVRLKASDANDAAQQSFELTGIRAFHPSLPEQTEGAHFLNLKRSSETPTRYVIEYTDQAYVDEVPPLADAHEQFLTVDQPNVGLDLEQLGERVFAFVGVKDSEVRHVWLGLLAGNPVSPKTLRENSSLPFPQIQSVGGEDVNGFNFLDFYNVWGKNLVVAWSTPPTLTASKVSFDASGDASTPASQVVTNPQWGADGAKDWTECTMPMGTLKTVAWPQQGGFQVEGRSIDGTAFISGAQFKTFYKPHAAPTLVVYKEKSPESHVYYVEASLPTALVSDVRIWLVKGAGGWRMIESENVTGNPVIKTWVDGDRTFYSRRVLVEKPENDDDPNYTLVNNGNMSFTLQVKEFGYVSFSQKISYDDSFSAPEDSSLSEDASTWNRPIFTWGLSSSSAGKSLYYFIQLEREDGESWVSTLESKRVLDATSFQIPEAAPLAEGSYRWRVGVSDSIDNSKFHHLRLSDWKEIAVASDG